MTPDGARCATHADRPAVDTCTRCGGFVCGECGEVFKEALYCAACFALVRPAEVSRRAKWALGLGLGAVLGPVLLSALHAVMAAPLVGIAVGAAAAITARLELAAIGRGEAPRGGRTRTLVGLVLGLVAVALFLALVVLALVVLALVLVASRRERD